MTHRSATYVCRQCEQRDCGQCASPLCECDHSRRRRRKPRPPEDRDRSTSIRTASAGLPTLGKKR